MSRSTPLCHGLLLLTSHLAARLEFFALCGTVHVHLLHRVWWGLDSVYVPAFVCLLSTRHTFRYQAIEHRPLILLRTISSSQYCLSRGE